MFCGDYEKIKIREIVKEIGLVVYNKKDSEEICFIFDNNYGKYILELKFDRVRMGNFVDKNGNIFGKYKGIVYYIIG